MTRHDKLEKNDLSHRGLVPGGGGPQAIGAVYTLTDMNSTVNIDPTIQMGMYDWIVDGRDILYQQWFWYRIGNAPEQSIDTANSINVAQPAPNILVLTHTWPGLFDIRVSYLLTGGTAGSYTSDLAESIRIRNLSRSTLDFHFFQYTDFDLGASLRDNVAILSAGNVINQYPVSGPMWTHTVATTPSRYEAALFPATRSRLNDALATTLNNVANMGPGDVTWALQWDAMIAPNGTYLISKNKLVQPVIPEPTTILMLGGVLLLVGSRLRRRMV